MKKQPSWILKKTAIMIHEAQLAEHGGAEGVRDIGLLESALAHPINLFSYDKADISKLATGYAERTIKNYPFVDGNKRTAYTAMVLFLELNEFKLVAPKEEKIAKFVQLAASEITTEDFAAWLANNIEPIKKKLEIPS